MTSRARGGGGRESWTIYVSRSHVGRRLHHAVAGLTLSTRRDCHSRMKIVFLHESKEHPLIRSHTNYRRRTHAHARSLTPARVCIRSLRAAALAWSER
ncbi:unnamed protein product, partial [Iphiclides podalirius]